MHRLERCRVVDHLAAVTEKFGRFAGVERGVLLQHHDGLVRAAPSSTFGRLWRLRWMLGAGILRHSGAVCQLPFGSFDGVSAAGINLFDGVVHGWEIAIGAGVTHDVDQELADIALRVAALLVTDVARESGQFARPLILGSDATSAAQLLSLTGRQLTRLIQPGVQE